MGLFDQIIEETVALLKSDSALSSCRILKAHPDQFHQSPLSKVTVTVSFAGAEIANAAMGDFYGKSADITLNLTVWSPLRMGGEAAWTAASNLCGALMFSGLGFMNIQCGEISYDSSAMAFSLPCRAKKKLMFGQASSGEAVAGVVVKGKLASKKGVK